MNKYKDRYNKTHINATCTSGTYWNLVPNWHCDRCPFTTCDYHGKNRYNTVLKEFGSVESLIAYLENQNSDKKEVVIWQ